MKLEINVPSEVEESLNEKCKKTRKEPSELVELLLEWYFLKRKKPEINEIGNANDLLRIADYCAKEKMYNCKYSDIDNCTRDVKARISEKPKPLHPYMCLFCSYFEDKREQDKEGQEREEKSKTEDAVDEHKIARIAAGIVMEQYGNKMAMNPDTSGEPNLSEEGSKELSFDEFEEEIEEESENDLEPEKELITRDKVEKLLEDW